MQDYFSCEDDERAKAVAKKVAYEACSKIVHDLIYNARWQAVVDYYAKHKFMKLTKTDAIKTQLTKEEYMKVVD
jgi:hypothetical protein